jgi:hypothetical protein
MNKRRTTSVIVLCAGAMATAALADSVDPRRALPQRFTFASTSGSSPVPANTLRAGFQRALEGTFANAPVATLQSGGRLTTVNTRGEVRMLSETGVDVIHNSVSFASTPTELANGDVVVAGLTGLEGIAPDGARRFFLPGTFRNVAPLGLEGGGFVALRTTDAVFMTARGELLRTLPFSGVPISAPWRSAAGAATALVVRDAKQVSIVRLAEEPLQVASFRGGAKTAQGSGSMVAIVYDHSVISFDLKSRDTREFGDLDSACVAADDTGASVMGVRQGRIVLMSFLRGEDARTLDLGIAPLGDGGLPTFGCALLRQGATTWFATSTGRAGAQTSAAGVQSVGETICGAESPPVAVVPWGNKTVVVLCSQGRIVRISGG